MKIFYNKSRHGIVMMVVLAMLLQIIRPVVSNYVYAEVVDESFKIVGERIENGTAFIQWEFTLDPNDRVIKHTHTGNFTLDDAVEGEELIGYEDDTDEDGTVIGTYSISKDGKITITINPELYKVFEDVDANDNVVNDTVTNSETKDDVGTDSEVSTEVDNSVDRVDNEKVEEGEGSEGNDVEPTEDQETVENDGQEDNSNPNEIEEFKKTEESKTSEGMIGKALGVVASLSNSFEGATNEEVRTFYSGIIEVGGAKEKLKVNSRGGIRVAGEGGEVIPKEEIGMKFVKLEVTHNGEKTEIEDSEDAKDLDLKEGQESKVYYEFNLGLSNPYSAGSYFSFQIPQSIMVFDENSLQGTIAIEGEPPFEYSTDLDGLVTVTFLDDVLPGEYNINLDFSAKFGNFGDDNDLDQKLEIPIEGNESITIDLTFLPSTSTEKMSKEGKVEIKDGEKFINWEVWVNKAGKNLKGAEFKDELGEGHQLVKDSIKVEKYAVGIKGIIEPAEENFISTGSFPLNLEDGKYAYKVIYQTEITRIPESETEIFGNSAKLINNGKQTDSSNIEIPITYGTPLSKVMVGGNKYRAEWEISYNYLGAAINPSEAKITDILDGAHEIDSSSIKVFEVEIDETGKEVKGSEKELELNKYEKTLSTDNKTLTIDFSNSAEGGKVTKAFKVTYDTVSTEEFILEGSNVKNTVTSTNTNSENQPYPAYGNLSLGEGIFSKSRGSIDYNKKEITWRLEINAEKDLNNFKIVDQFTKIDGKTHQILLENDGKTGVEKYFTIINYDTSKITLNESDLNVDEGYTLIFNEKITTGTKIIIFYKTKFAIKANGTAYGKYGNEATATWDGLTSNDNSIKKEADYTPKPGGSTNKNGYKNGRFDHVKQEFTWNIAVNINKQDINGAILTDELGAGHHIPVEESELKNHIKIYQLDLGVDDEDGKIGFELPNEKWEVIEVKKENEKIKEFTIEFKELTSEQNHQAYYISYTSIDDDNIIGRLDENNKKTAIYGNNAIFKTTEEYPLSSMVEVKNANELINKMAQQNPDQETITWTVDINKSHSTLGDIKLTDKLSANQMLLRDTIRIREYKIDINGSISYKDWESVNKDNIQLTEDGFILTLGQLDKKGYQVEYKTFFTGGNNEPYNNTASISYTGLNVEDGGNQSSHPGQYKFNASSGNISSNKGTVKLRKVGYNPETKEEINLPDVKFAMYNKTGEYKLYEAISDENGFFTFENIRYGTYMIKEEEVPEGYSKAEDITFSMNVESDFSIDGDVNKVIPVINNKVNQGVKLTKIDAENEELKLVGAVFTLYNASTNKPVTVDKYGKEIPASYTTDDNGEIFIDDLAGGRYYFVEEKAPEGYWLDKNTKINFEVKEGEVTNLKPVKNHKQGDFIIYKVDYSNGKPLEGAIFTLYDSNDDSYSNPLYTSPETVEDGIVKFTNIKYGSYIIKETKAPDGYVAYEDKNFTMNDEANILLTGNEKKVIKFENKKIYQAVKLTKVDADIPTKVLVGAKFTLYREDGTKVSEHTTDGNGVITVNNLEPGIYYFKETEAPKYYILPANAETEKFEIKPNQTVFTNVKATNTRGKGKIAITKVDADYNTILLEGVEFTLSNADGSIEKIATTDENGKIVFENLQYDTYTIVETKAHPDYVPKTTPIEVVLDGEIDKVFKEITVENTKKDHSVRLTKYNANMSRVLKGAIFELRKETNGKYEVVAWYESLTTDDKGEIYLENLPVGKYQFIEIKAPSGYYIDRNPVGFEIEENQTKTIELKKTNRLYDPEPEEPPTKPTKPPVDPEKPDPEKPVDPKDPKPEKPVDPTKPVEPTDPTNPTDPVKPTVPPTEEEKPTVPTEPQEPTIKEKTPKEKPIEIDPKIPEGSTPKIVEEPKNGKVTFDENGKWIYTPNPDFVGKDSFIIRVTHPDGTEEDIFIEIDVEDPLGGIEVPTLPKTGQVNSMLMYLAGLFFIVVGIILRRRKTA